LGTPIPEEDKEADQWLTRKQKEEKYKNKFVPLWQQEVVALLLFLILVRSGMKKQGSGSLVVLSREVPYGVLGSMELWALRKDGPLPLSLLLVAVEPRFLRGLKILWMRRTKSC
jgi:hypothetical protein